MHNKKRNKSIGLDIGQTATKVVWLARSGRKAVVKRAEVFRSREEGILGDDESEQLQAVSGWLKELKLLDERLVIGLPQYMSTMQVSDFAPGAKGVELEKMVTLETTQLSGLSDDSFLHDYAVMKPGNGRVNPVLIGICREANVNDYVGRLYDVSMKVEDVAMNGLALANAFFQLKPKEAKAAGVQLLMDIGTENTTLVIVSGGQVLYIGGMMFGGRNVTQELAGQLGVSQDEAERRKTKGEVDWAALNMSLLEKTAAEDASVKESLLPDEPTPATEGIGGIGGKASPEPLLPLNDGDGQNGEQTLEYASPIKDYYRSSNDGDGEDGEQPVKLKLKLPFNLGKEDGGDSLAEKGEDAGGMKLGTEFSGTQDEAVVPMEQEMSEAPMGLACFQTLIRELDNCLEHWRSSENEALVNEKISHIWLSGGSAKLEQIGAYLSISQDCETEVFGPVLKKGEDADPEFTLAYGLALQGLGLAEMPISLTPVALTWLHKKESRFGYLVFSFLLFFIVVYGWLFYEYQRLVDSIKEMEDNTEVLRGSVRNLQALDGMKRDYSEILLQALPVVSSTCRTQTYLTALERLQKAVKSASFDAPEFKDCINWCVYVADEDSFKEYNEQKEQPAAAQPVPAAGGGRRGRRQLLADSTDTVNEDSQQRWQEIQAKEIEPVEVIASKGLKQLYVVGIIMSKNDNRNVIEREIMLNLETDGKPSGEKSDFFDEVQVMNEDERSRCRIRAILDWERCFANMRTSEAFKSYDYKPFFLRLGLRDSVIHPPAENPLAEKKKGKKGKKK